MKIKYLIMIMLAVLSVYIIYNHNYNKNINILSISSVKDNYNPFLSNYLTNSNLKFNLNIDYSTNLEIENLIGLINNNKNKIQSIINNSDIIILNIGNIDILTEDTKTIINELKELFILLRKINTKEIIYISPNNIKNTIYIKELCQKYNILFINSSSFNNIEQLSKTIYRKIESQYNAKKD
ncbi:MAG: hypothetical protein E7159_05245 [Firmicutes bacterium]|nr:hypothetical protein [Bacillota bacterium]